MKRIFLILSLILVVAGFAKANDKEDYNKMWDDANTAYINANYLKAIATYDSIVDAGYESHKLYYNLGNAYFKSCKIGKAMLNYNRALLLSPNDSDTKHNILVTSTYVKDNIQSVPEFFLVRWFRALRQTASSNTWAIMSLVAFVLATSSVLLYLLVSKIAIRKIGFFGAIVCLLCFIVFTSYSVVEKNDLINSTSAIVMSSAASVKSSPDNSSKDLFVLHEGTKVTIISTLNRWAEVVIADGKKGWIPEGSIEII